MKMTDDYSQQSYNKESIDPVEFQKMIAEHAYFKAEKRGFAVGHEIEDWLEAEQEVSKQCFYWVQEEW
jgi:DNA-directed RNA polymerase